MDGADFSSTELANSASLFEWGSLIDCDNMPNNLPSYVAHTMRSNYKHKGQSIPGDVGGLI